MSLSKKIRITCRDVQVADFNKDNGLDLLINKLEKPYGRAPILAVYCMQFQMQSPFIFQNILRFFIFLPKFSNILSFFNISLKFFRKTVPMTSISRIVPVWKLVKQQLISHLRNLGCSNGLPKYHCRLSQWILLW